MSNELISCLRVDLYDCKQTPATILKPFLPAKAINKAWIPQTMGDQIWVLFEFAALADRFDWEISLSEQISKWLDRDLIPHALGYGWHARDMNGFYR